MSADTSWDDEADLSNEAAGRLDRFLQAGQAETHRLVAEGADVEQKLAESLDRLAADAPQDASWGHSLLKGHHTV
ncbi:hypothetical protein [Streptomyces chartreusis]